MKHIIIIQYREDEDEDVGGELLKMLRRLESYGAMRSFDLTFPPCTLSGIFAPRICGAVVSERTAATT